MRLHADGRSVQAKTLAKPLAERPDPALDIYRANKKPHLSGAFLERMMGLEPTTFCMASRRSSQLSYIRVGGQYSPGPAPFPASAAAALGRREAEAADGLS